MSDDVAVRTADPSQVPGRDRGARKAVAVAMAVVLLVGVAACTSDDGPAQRAERATTSTTATPETAPAPELLDAECPDASTPAEPGGRLSCQRLILPEDRSHPEERQVELPVLTLRPAEEFTTTTEEPVVYLHGGPGGGAVERWATWATTADALGTELVVYDQRGGGASVPRLDCPEHSAALLDALNTDDAAGEREEVAESLAACHERLVREGVDLDQYDVAASVADLDDLRRALGVDRLRLVASSYGTRLALEYAATHPDHVSAMALDSLDPPEEVWAGRDAEQLAPAIERLLSACEDDAACAAAHPALSSSLATAVERADDIPIVIELPTDDGTSGRTIAVNGDDLLAGLFAALYDSDVVPLLPATIEAVASGNDAVLASVGPRLAGAVAGGATGALMSVNCAALPDDAAASSEIETPDGADTLELTGWDTFCGEWPVERAPSTAEASVTGAEALGAEVPVLVVAGALDPITPAATSRRLAQRWGASYLEIPRAGHAPMLVDRCARDVLRSFLAEPSTPDLSCADSLTPTPFS